MALGTTTRLTYDDFVRLPDEGKRYEIIDGELFVNAAPVPQHRRIVRKLLVRFGRYFEEHGGGEAFPSPIDVYLDEHNIVEPDTIVVKSERASIVGPKNVQGAPHLVVEVISDGSRRKDEITKRKLYDQFRVDEYWIVDPELELVKIYRRTAVAFERVAEIDTDAGGTLTTPLLPGFAYDVRELLP